MSLVVHSGVRFRETSFEVIMKQLYDFKINIVQREVFKDLELMLGTEKRCEYYNIDTSDIFDMCDSIELENDKKYSKFTYSSSIFIYCVDNVYYGVHFNLPGAAEEYLLKNICDEFWCDTRSGDYYPVTDEEMKHRVDVWNKCTGFYNADKGVEFDFTNNMISITNIYNIHKKLENDYKNHHFTDWS